MRCVGGEMNVVLQTDRRVQPESHQDVSALTSDFTFAFQPIFDVDNHGRPFAYEALVRGPNGESADTVLGSVPQEERLSFDAECREKAIEMAVSLGIEGKLSLNILADAVCDPHYGLMATLRAARRHGFPPERLIFEVTEHVPVTRPERLGRWMSAARSRGFIIAIDDFGAGYAAINLLLRLRPSMIKLDMDLIRGIDADMPRQSIVRGIIEACSLFNCVVVAEGVETSAEFQTLRRFGVRLMQGYFFARPAIASAPLLEPMAANLCGFMPEPFVHSAAFLQNGYLGRAEKVVS